MKRFTISDLPIFNKDLGKIYKENYNLGKYSWFGVGGEADVLFTPHNLEDLSYFLKNVNKNIPITIIGNLSNCLIRDGGVRGVVIKLKNFNHIRLTNAEDYLIKVGAGYLNSAIADFAYTNNIANLEFLATIPGNIGGSVAMNAGCFGNEISDILENLITMDYEGNVQEFKRKEINFSYRFNPLSTNFIFLEVTLRGKKGLGTEILEKMRQNNEKRQTAQPARVKTGGSTFKNPNNSNFKAWELIRQAKCDTAKIGGASMSAKHANFLINDGNATARNIEDLIEFVQKEVLSKTGILLETEIKLLGNY